MAETYRVSKRENKIMKKKEVKKNKKKNLIPFLIESSNRGKYPNLFWLDKNSGIFVHDRIKCRNPEFTDDHNKLYEDYCSGRKLAEKKRQNFISAMNNSKFFIKLENEDYLKSHQISDLKRFWAYQMKECIFKKYDEKVTCNAQPAEQSPAMYLTVTNALLIQVSCGSAPSPDSQSMSTSESMDTTTSEDEAIPDDSYENDGTFGKHLRDKPLVEAAVVDNITSDAPPSKKEIFHFLPRMESSCDNAPQDADNSPDYEFHFMGRDDQEGN